MKQVTEDQGSAAADRFLDVVRTYLSLGEPDLQVAAAQLRQRARRGLHLEPAVDRLAADLGDAATSEQIDAVRGVAGRYRSLIERGASVDPSGTAAQLRLIGLSWILAPLAAAALVWVGERELTDLEGELAAAERSRRDAVLRLDQAVAALSEDAARAAADDLDACYARVDQLTMAVAALRLRRAQAYAAPATAALQAGQEAVRRAHSTLEAARAAVPAAEERLIAAEAQSPALERAAQEAGAAVAAAEAAAEAAGRRVEERPAARNRERARHLREQLLGAR